MGSSTHEPARARGYGRATIEPPGGASAVFTHPVGDDAELTPLEPWHAEELFAVVERFREYLTPTIPLARLAHTVDEVRASLQRFADGHANDTRHMFAVRQDGQIVGAVQLFSFDAAAG